MSTHSGLDSLSLPVAILIGSVIIGGSIIFSSARAPATAPAQQAVKQVAGAAAAPAQPKQAVDIKTIKATGPQVVGAASAPIVMAYWYDYQCPVCQRADESVVSQVMTEYVATGKIRIVFKDLQFLGADSTTLGLAAKAVDEVAPSKFYAWHKSIYDNQGKENSGWATKDKIREITLKTLTSSETDSVMSLMVSKAVEYQKLLDADKAEGAALGIRATPSFVIGKQLMVGLSAYANVKAAIDTAIAK